MPFIARKATLSPPEDIVEQLTKISRSRTEPMARVSRADTLLTYIRTRNVSQTAAVLGTNRMKVNRLVNRALEVGCMAALEDLPRSGKPPSITQDDIAWLLSVVCRKPTELGFPHEIWTLRLLVRYVRDNCRTQGHPSLANLTPGAASRILNKREVRPHKFTYYLERKDPAFDSKFAQVLLFYKGVNFLLDTGLADLADTTFISFDEKPGIQALERTAPDLPPVPGKYTNPSRDYEYKRHGTVALMAGVDLLTGHVHRRIVDKYDSEDMIEFLKGLDEFYPPTKQIRIILDNHSMHTSKRTREYLATQPNRFEFVFTPKHASWLNLIETFFSKMARTLLREIRVASKAELISRMEQFIDQLNENPVIFRWKYKMDERDSLL